MVESIEELRRICQNFDEDDTIRRDLRSISIYITKLLLYTDITANQVTLIFILSGLIGACLLFFGNYLYSIIGALFLQLMFILDNVDGEIARYRKTYTIKGLYLESIGHKLINPLVFTCISFGVYNNLHDIRIFLFGFSAAISLSLIEFPYLVRNYLLYSSGESEKVRVRNVIKKETENFKKLRRLFAPFSKLFKLKGFVDLILIGAIFNLLHVVLVFYGITFPIIMLITIYRIAKHGFEE